MTLDEQVLSALRLASGIAGYDYKRDRLVVGVSGGPDSLALLHALRKHIPIDKLVVAHLDHGLRPSSTAEAIQVAAMAGGLRFHTERVDVSALARATGQSQEEAGRTARYNFFARVAQMEMAIHIAVGHNRDDQVETILMHLLRGSGLAGLRGMQPISPLPGNADLWLLRPLLAISRDEIETYCVENELAPIVDESNASQAFLRNRIRAELLPILETYNPQFRRRLTEMSDIIAAEEELLDALSSVEWEKLVIRQGVGHVILNHDGWLRLPLALRRRLLRQAVAAVQPGTKDVGFRALESARDVAERAETGSQADLPGGISIRISYGQLVVTSGIDELSGRIPQLAGSGTLPLPIPGEIALAEGWRLTSEWLEPGKYDLDEIQRNQEEWQAYMVLAEGDTLQIRSRNAGERMQPLGLGGQRKIKEIMIDRKIPAHVRERWPVVATRDHAVWLVGHVLDERARVTTGTERVVLLTCLPPAAHEASLLRQ